jgi:hypothetical protein
MSIQVTGILIDPIGDPMETSIRITAENTLFTIDGAHADAPTGVDGSYSFSLEEGVYLVQLLQRKELTEGTTILVDGVTPSPITLGTLLANHEVLT